MKTLQQMKEQHISNTVDGRDWCRLGQFIPEEELAGFGLTLEEEHRGKHQHVEMTRDLVLQALEQDVAFGFKKALGKRGISSSDMYFVVKMWNWILEEGLEDWDDYPMYGLPLLKATAVKYGFPNPIGDDTGRETKYDTG